MADVFTPSPLAVQALRLLRDHHNVLLTGPPATGKSRLIGEVRRAFQLVAPIGYSDNGPTPFPKDFPEDLPVDIEDWLPSPERGKRRAFSDVFHPHSKHRDFVRGISPRLDGSAGFEVVDGSLVKANDFADEGASLLVIDEINRGPAVQLFGETIAAIESDKRRSPIGDIDPERTALFPLLQPDGSTAESTLSHHLYLLAAMNQADTSVEPLDVAFQRRWHPFALRPDRYALGKHFGVDVTNTMPAPTEVTVESLYLMCVRAWEAVNDRLSLGRGMDYQIGHGVLMQSSAPKATPDEVVRYLQQSWIRILAHIGEVFFDEPRAVAAVLRVGESAGHPWKLEERTFAGQLAPRLRTPNPEDAREFQQLLVAIAG